MSLSKEKIELFKKMNEQFKQQKPSLSEEDKKMLKIIDEKINFINQLITFNKQYIQILNASPKEKKGWKKKALEVAIEKLKHHKDRQIKHRAEINNQEYSGIAGGIQRMANHLKYGFSSIQDYDIFFLTPTFIFEDILWVYGITVKDVMDISLGKENKTCLEKYLPSLIGYINKEVIPYLNSHNEFKQRVKLINEAMKCAEKGFLNASNILLMSVIEGMVRVLAQFVIDKQNLGVKQYEFSSIESLINLHHRAESKRNKLKWHDEIFDGKESLYNYQKSVDEEVKNFLKEKKIDELHHIKTHTNFSERFDFLIKSYKDERNIIVHGNKDEFGEKWRYYIQLSALQKTYSEIKHYYSTYNKK